MSNKVDKLFKEKLEEHSLQPSAQAWEKVEAHIGKKNRMALWLRVAAAVAMLGLLVVAALNWTNNYEKPKQELVKKDVEKPAPVMKKEEEPKQELRKETPTKKNPVKVKPATTEPTIEQLAVVPEAGQQEAMSSDQYPGSNDQYPRSDNQLTSNNQQSVTTSQQKGITLTYTLPTIKKNEPLKEPADEPVVAGTKKTGLERVLEIAKEVKNGDNPLGELREAKNDILALEFRKDKDKKKQ